MTFFPITINKKFLIFSIIFLAIGLDFQFEANFGSLFDFRFRTSAYKSSSEYSSEVKNYDEKSAEVFNSKNQRIVILDGRGENPLNSYMKHIRELFENMGYKILTGSNIKIDQEWDVIWYHDYLFNYEPFATLARQANSNQIINHVPGSGHYSSKVALATSGLKKGVPKAFQLPLQKNDFLKYAKENPNDLWVQKDNNHRNIQIRKVNEMNLEKNNSFVQKFVDNPLLIDNRKFDIGIYTVVTSILPLRVFIYDGDVLIRFCPKDYHPLDVKNVDKYVVGDDYTPIWEIDSLSELFNNQKMSFKHTIDAYLGKRNMNSSQIWTQIIQIIGEVFQTQQPKMLQSMELFPLKSNYFELSRFDFVVDEDLNVFLMEANMSPNLSSGHFQQNQILYEKVLMSIFSLTGIGNQLDKKSKNNFQSRNVEHNPIVNNRDINLPLKFCVESKCLNCDEALECQLCGHCMSSETRKFLESTYLEHLNRREMRRVRFNYSNKKPLTKEDHLLNIWMQTKCSLDISWCY